MADDDRTQPPPPLSAQHPQYGQQPGPAYGEQGRAHPVQGYGEPPDLGQPPPPSGTYLQQPMPPPTSWYAGPPSGPLGKVRGTGMVIGLTIITLGIYSLVYYYSTHEEMKRHSGDGLGGVLALVLAFFVGIVSPFLLSKEVGDLYERQGRPAPVTALTGLWVFPGILILIGPIVWLVKTNGALNAYWRALGAR
jgi:hypothetical protein